uniref:Uncharacterized protein n=1 Tax=Cacopsylla melanoneura TaxID=428564 RepID=A0A8D8Y6P1_9HEMI
MIRHKTHSGIYERFLSPRCSTENDPGRRHTHRGEFGKTNEHRHKTLLSFEIQSIDTHPSMCPESESVMLCNKCNNVLDTNYTSSNVLKTAIYLNTTYSVLKSILSLTGH